MKLLTRAVALAVAAAGVAVMPTAVNATEARNPSLVQQIRDEAQGNVNLNRLNATGMVGFARVTDGGDLMPSMDAGNATDAAAKASAYLSRFGGAFGARRGELRQLSVTPNTYGWTVAFEQVYNGVPVFGSRLMANLDQEGELRAVNGYAAPALALSTTPTKSAERAGQTAVAAVIADPPGEVTSASLRAVSAAKSQLVIYRMGATKGEPGAAILAWAIEVGNGTDVRDMVFVDAHTGKIVNRYSMIHEALERHLLEAAESKDPSTFTEVWKEGDALPGTLNEDQQNEVNFTGDSYWMFKNTFGRDSYDGLGHSMTTVNNDGRINCPNANWNGTTTNYCDGITSDDTVAHEWTHAYTEYTHGLIYQWQPGALNESYSDIFGEIVDMTNSAQNDPGEGAGDTHRPVGQCSAHSPAAPVLTINAPTALKKDCDAGAASFGAQLDGTGITGDVALGLDDNPTDATQGERGEINGCTPMAAPLTGKIALLQRGNCGFAIKVKNAQNAGAVAAIVMDRVAGSATGMAGEDQTITIPSVRITLEDGEKIRTALVAGESVNVTMKDAAGDRVDSYRWLSGENDPGFNGAIRDMWMPTCYGHPGKVSDAEYFCGTDDQGGVHRNSGVPNHGFSLLVDGATYNNIAVTGIGLDKAANIYYRAMTNYQTPTTDFNAHADALLASCTDLVGKPINKVTSEANAVVVPAPSITTADCGQVANMINAVELRKAPEQCKFEPLFVAGNPSLCGPGFKTNIVWSEDFEKGLTNWTADKQIANTGGINDPWVASTEAPGGHLGGVAFGSAGDLGQCSGGEDDFSSVDSITSPVIELPGSAKKAPKLSWEHYVATELGYDGGNVSISVNGGAFAPIPTAAYTFNAPKPLKTAAEENTNPLAGQDGFSGTNGGSVFGSWGVSQVDLLKVGVQPGDTIQVRFNIGRDGCGGIDGWYVDNVTVSTCKLGAKIKAARESDPTTVGQESRVRVTVERDGSRGAAPQGAVSLTDSSGAQIGTGTLVKGQALVTVPASYPAGTHVWTATYVGDDTFESVSTSVTATIKAPLSPVASSSASPSASASASASATASVSASSSTAPTSAAGAGSGAPAKAGALVSVQAKKKIEVRRDIKVRVAVRSASGADASGLVRLTANGTLISTKTLKSGKVAFRITKAMRTGNVRLVAQYLGSDTTMAGKSRLIIKVKRG